MNHRVCTLIAIIAVAALIIANVPYSQSTVSGINGKIAFPSDRDGNFEIYVMNSDGSGQANLSNNVAHDGEPNWSPDGTKIAFNSDRDGNEEIYVMNADGTGQANLSNNPATDTDPDWQPINPIAIQNLINDINNMSLDSTVEKKLIHHLDKALKELTDNKLKSDKVCHELNEFIKEVGKQENTGNLTAAQALQLEQSTNVIKASLGCP